MSGNTFGTLFSVTSFGESHGPAIGCVVDGCPPGLALAEADIQAELDRRKPGTSRHVTQRREPDSVEILSGVFEGKTTGTPIALLIRNQDQRSKDYGNIAETFRPGPCRLHLHAQVRLPRLSRRRPFFGARDGGARRGRGDCPQVAAGALRRDDPRLDERARADRDPLRQCRRHRRQCLLRGRMPASSRNSRRTWTTCASRAIRSARGSR